MDPRLRQRLWSLTASADTWYFLEQVASPALEKIIARAAAEEADDEDDTDDDLRHESAAAVDLAPALTTALRQYMTQVESTCGTRAVKYLTQSQATMLRRVLPE